MTRTTPPSPNIHATSTGGRLATTYDLSCDRPHTRRIFGGIGFRTWNPPAPKLRLGHRGLEELYEEFPGFLESKLKEGVFVDPDIIKLKKNLNFKFKMKKKREEKPGNP
ncbi:hypothetical protein AVEN_149341-1 [Araneus ventricosus]|uniref:Uncharacterized protein n=1 Tax=Araneus ventricosus TaxID=182803 RepID=A0A4Y2P2V2_ARAVE|nr:hypothetical protein AVEN_32931-1 [Araneus ventricosus]GBN45292.1 hypothetical protein AVEN_56160-1 [Araneus ventricosus]GBN45306.1 hypothetical protein AVEN_67494-1 [Araneus ventricosus]GBN45339.1 hypothetical protein AVEN_149341-1 [Araneus ventricosus]